MFQYTSGFAIEFGIFHPGWSEPSQKLPAIGTFLRSSIGGPKKGASGTVGRFPIVKLEFDLSPLPRFWLELSRSPTQAKIVQVKVIAAILIYPSD